jgi:hypothetical protein
MPSPYEEEDLTRGEERRSSREEDDAKNENGLEHLFYSELILKAS